MSTPNDTTTEQNKPAYQMKLAVHERDMYRCLCCRESFQDASKLDADHYVPRGQGGPNTHSNKGSLCRRCHEAKGGERGHAPTVRFQSTGDMIDKDFRWFRQLWKEQFPALTEAVAGYRVEPKFNLSEDTPYQAWHIPLGDLRRLDEVLSDVNSVSYPAMAAHHYM